jgi:hypothetical protein
MNDPTSPERLAEQLRADITRARHESEVCVIVHIPVLESLLAEVGRLTAELAKATSRVAELEGERREQQSAEWEPSRWYRVTQPNGDLWMETSDREEAVNAAHKTGWELTRLWRSESYEWRPTTSDVAEGGPA